jgi:cysteine-rich repeat protein
VLDPHEQCDGLLGLQPCNTTTCVQEVCGNGILDQDAAHGVLEQCDDGNTDPGDGCSATCQFERCGNGVTDPGEQCDDGDDNTDAPTCPYNATCTSCSTSCRTVTLNPHCGDGIVDSGSEVCDDGNADACGSCSATCSQVTSSQAIGFIVPPAGGALDDGETFTLDDGINPPTVFQFQAVEVLHAGLTGGNVIISFSGTDTDAVIGEAIAAAILQRHTDGLLLIAPVTDPDNTDDALVLLRHDRFTALGNHQIASTVSSAGFLTIGMAGGKGGDCNDGTGCTRDADCASNFCDTSSHACATPSGLHLASRAH